MALISKAFAWNVLLLIIVVSGVNGASKNVNNLDYKVFPKRKGEESAVLEWGHSAIISAIDATVAHFGPQTSQAALLEVECMPILADPIDGKGSADAGLVETFKNAEEVHGNIVVMTNQANVTGWELAKLAQANHAVALIVVNIDERNPDEVYRMQIPEGKDPDEIDIPCVVISYSSAGLLTSATVKDDTKPEDVVNNGMPDRIRLYAGGDRPFFEEIIQRDPTLYLIHNMLLPHECDKLIAQSKSSSDNNNNNDLTPNLLEFTTQDVVEKMHNVQRTFVPQGMWQSPSTKAIEERIEQVTGYPADCFTDFIVDKYSSSKGSHWKPHHDQFPNMVAIVTITIFLDDDGPEIVFPDARRRPIKIKPRRGMAVVHHNTNERKKRRGGGGDNEYETYLNTYSLHAMLETTTTSHLATKFVLKEPLSRSRRVVLPIFQTLLNSPTTQLYKYLIDKFQVETGSLYFDKILLFGPMLVLLFIVQFIVDRVQKRQSEERKKLLKTIEKKLEKKD